MVTVTCEYCGSQFEPYGDYANYTGPVPCASCHKSTWVAISDDRLTESKKWPIS